MADPDLSAVTVGLDGDRSLGPLLRALAAQTVADRIEVVAVVPEGALPRAPRASPPCTSVRVPELTTTGEAIAAGVPRRDRPRGRLHARSTPGRGRTGRSACSRRTTAGRRAVSWSLENANPESVTSWVHLLSDFGPAVHPTPCAPAAGAAVAPHLLPPRAAHGLRRGPRGDARGRVAGPCRPGPGRTSAPPTPGMHAPSLERLPLRQPLRDEWRGARSFGASRVDHGNWGPARRLAYAAAAPLLFARAPGPGAAARAAGRTAPCRCRGRADRAGSRRRGGCRGMGIRGRHGLLAPNADVHRAGPAALPEPRGPRALGARGRQPAGDERCGGVSVTTDSGGRASRARSRREAMPSLR